MSLLDRLIHPLRIGVITSRYPSEPPVLQPATRQLPMLDAARCTREASCVAVCPTAAIVLGADSWAVDAGRCVFCGACARACPTDAIRLDGGVTHASKARRGLLHITPLASGDGTQPARLQSASAPPE